MPPGSRGGAGRLVLIPSALLPAQIVAILLGSFGSAANSAVIALLVRARRLFGTSASVNYLIVNQSTMDLCSCVLIALTVSLKVTNATVIV